MPVELLNPDDLDPDETHEYAEGDGFVVEDVPGVVLDRGYTIPSNRPVYAVICDDNVTRTFTEAEIGSWRVQGPMGDGGERLRYDPGDLVVDAYEVGEDRETAVIVRYVREADDTNGNERLRTARDHEFEPGTTVAEVNPDEFADDLVVEVAFESHLDTTVPAWRNLLADAEDPDSRTFADLLLTYYREWSIEKRVYAYPEGRIMPQPWCRSCGERAEWVGRDGSGGVTDEDGYACSNADCTNPDVTTDEVRSALDDEGGAAVP